MVDRDDGLLIVCFHLIHVILRRQLCDPCNLELAVLKTKTSFCFLLCVSTNNVLCVLLVAHNIYGVAHTINSANYVYFLGLEKVMTLDHPSVTKVFTG